MTKEYEKFLVGFCATLAMLYLWASDMYVPAFGLMAESFGTSESDIGGSLSVFFLGLAFSQLIFGSISDQFGRKPLLITGLVIYIVGCVGCYFSQTIDMFTLFRVITAIGACSTMVLWQAIVVDSFEEVRAHQIFGFVYMLLGLSPALAPLVGGIVTEYSHWRYIFIFLGGYGALLLFLSALVLKESISKAAMSDKFSVVKLAEGYVRLAASRFFVCMSMAAGLLVGIYMIYITLTPFILSDLGYSPKEIGLSFLPIAVSFMVGSKLSTHLLNVKTIDWVIKLGMFSTILGSVAMLLAVGVPGLTTAWQLIIPMMFLTFCNGIAIPTSVSRIIQQFPSISGTASSAVGFLIAFIPFLLMTVGLQFVGDYGYLALIALLMVSSIIIVVMNILGNLGSRSETGERLVLADH